jgi:hypothetical protein
MYVPVPGAGAWGAAELMLVGGILLLGLAALASIAHRRSAHRGVPATA